MALAIFDLDNTLLVGDSDYLWGVFLAEQGVVDGAWYQQQNQKFFQEYKEGRLDIHAFLRFSLAPLKEQELAVLQRLRERYLQERIEPLITPAALELVDGHRRAGDTLMIITATNAFVTAPIARRFGIDHLIATEPEVIDGRYSGAVSGTPSFREGKVLRLEQWLAEHGGTLAGSTFYSDSHNDLPLLERVTYPVAVNPDDTLRMIAEQRGWSVLRF